MLLSLLCELFGRACFRFVAFFFGKFGSGMAKAGRISGAEGTLCLFGWELAGSRGLGFFWASSSLGGGCAVECQHQVSANGSLKVQSSQHVTTGHQSGCIPLEIRPGRKVSARGPRNIQ